MQRIFEQFEETPAVRLISIVPVAAVAEGDHETLFITCLERYAHESRIRGALVLGRNHPEHEWRDRGRPGHPFFMVSMADDIGTDYVSMPDSGGGGKYRYDFSLRVKPGIPEDARTVTLSVCNPEWNTGATRTFFTEGTRPAARWEIRVDPASGTSPIKAQRIS